MRWRFLCSLPLNRSVRVVAGGALAFFLASTLLAPTGEAIEFLADDVLVSGTGEVGTGIIHVDPVTGDQTLVSAGDFDEDFAIGPYREIYALDGDAVVHIDPVTGVQTIVTSAGLLVFPVGIAFGGTGDLYVLDWDAFEGQGGIIRVNPENGMQSALVTGFPCDDCWPPDDPVPPNPVDIETGKNGDLIVLFEAVFDTMEVFSFDPVTGDPTFLSPMAMTFGVTGLGVAPDGDVLVCPGDALATYCVEIDPVTLAATAAGGIVAWTPDGFVEELVGTDVAVNSFDEVILSALWTLGYSRESPNPVPPGVFLTEEVTCPSGTYFEPAVDENNEPLSVGHFSEIQVVALEVGIDIKPGSCPNSWNRNSKGVLAVAILGTEDLDVTEIDVSSVKIRRADATGDSVAPNEGPPGPQSVFEDVGAPFEGGECDCHEAEGDGILDLSMKFKTRDVADLLPVDDPNGALVPLVVSFTLLDGTEFTSRSDCVRLVPPESPPGRVTVQSVPGSWIDATPLDNQFEGGGFGSFERTYAHTTVLTLTGPSSYNGNPFVGWKLDEGELVQGRSITFVVNNAEHTARAVFKKAESCGLGFELALLVPPLMWLYGRRMRRLA